MMVTGGKEGGEEGGTGMEGEKRKGGRAGRRASPTATGTEPFFPNAALSADPVGCEASTWDTGINSFLYTGYNSINSGAVSQTPVFWNKFTPALSAK